MMREEETVASEGLEVLLDLIYRQFHHDFRSYSRASLLRGVDRARISMRMPSTARLIEELTADPAIFPELLRHLTIQVSDLFRDPPFWAALREKVVPHLATYPSLRLWVAGCGTGEEAYSLAILLHEEGLLDRTLIYATDIASHSLQVAEAGIYDRDRVRGFTDNYFKAGGRRSLSEYYTAGTWGAAFSRLLKNRILFAEHSLATDAAFAEVQLVTCRNVLIYFNSELQRRAVGLFTESICPRGFLGLGASETLAHSPHASFFEAIASDQRIYRSKGTR